MIAPPKLNPIHSPKPPSSNSLAPYPDGGSAINRTDRTAPLPRQENGWGIGVASANDNVAKLEKVLSTKVDNTTFTPEFFNSSAFQYHWFNKTISLEAIAKYYDTDPRCMILLDDAGHNRKYAEAYNVHFQHVNATYGVQWWDYEQAKKALFNRCNCGTLKDRSYTSFYYAPPDRDFAGRDK
ncbi:hypothetical protein GPECTOR_22g767 [Gonium pectorale]|uniref:Uncharacterized protein n=1 Tax=Gonium pectorale TaxID=33097 RepID=A0A150GH91_GONPE|nr:hypothetical protein GPECTOR_22g767 [Gonium pectorale]|eukprot:KXZ49177.1 hypothetical protein GPECTOR_22g767 [Gonium pectorale]